MAAIGCPGQATNPADGSDEKKTVKGYGDSLRKAEDDALARARPIDNAMYQRLNGWAMRQQCAGPPAGEPPCHPEPITTVSPKVTDFDWSERRQEFVCTVTVTGRAIVRCENKPSLERKARAAEKKAQGSKNVKKPKKVGSGSKG